MAETIYVLCAVTSLWCTVLLLRRWRQTRVALLFWSGICFLMLTTANVLLFVDLSLVPQMDLAPWRNGVTVLAPTNLPATVPVHASQLYSRNVTAFLNLLIKDGELHIDMNDDVVGPACVTHQGQWMNQRVAAAIGAT